MKKILIVHGTSHNSFIYDRLLKGLNCCDVKIIHPFDIDEEYVNKYDLVVGHSLGGYTVYEHLNNLKCEKVLLLSPLIKKQIFRKMIFSASRFSWVCNPLLWFLQNVGVKKTIYKDNIQHLEYLKDVSETKDKLDMMLEYLHVGSVPTLRFKPTEKDVVIMFGEFDEVVPVEDMLEFSKELMVEPIIVKNCGHTIFVEKEVEVLEQVYKMLT